MSTATPDWLNKGDNAWQLTASTFVALQSIGLVIIYGGIVKKKWAVNSAFMALYAFAATMVFWSLWGFRMSFGDPLFLNIVGRPDFSVLSQKFLLAQGFTGQYPAATLVFFQFVFAAITLVLIAGALLGRMNFKAWMLFVPLWLTFSYTVGAFSMWSPHGFLFSAGVMDFAGGFVIHLSSGVAGFTAAFWVGPRIAKDRESFPPNNIILTLVGAGLLWIGWAGFNGGAPYAANTDTSLAIYNTHLCTATSLLVWLCLDFMKFGKPSVIGAVQGMITGLVCITPAAGLVQVWAAMIMGVFSGSIPWFTMMVLHKKIKFLKYVDDTLAIFHTHAVAGTLGGLLTGIFAEPNLNRIFFGDDPKFVGLIYAIKNGRSAAGFHQIGMQIAGMAFILVLNVVMTSIICLGIRLLVPLRLSVEEMTIGDDSVHGEEAYAVWGDGETFEQSMHGNQHYVNNV